MDREKLIREAVAGSSEAFETLVLELYEQLYRTAYIYMKNREDSLDVLQETAYRGIKSIHQLKDPNYFKTWLMRILINVAYDELKKKKGVISLNGKDYFGESEGMEDLVSEKVDLERGLRHLKEDHRSVILLFYYHEFSIREIAEVMGVPEGTVKTYLSRGRKALEKWLKGEGYERGYYTTNR